MDSTLILLIRLKNQWTLTGSGFDTGSLVFTTNWYSENVVVPQITISPFDSQMRPIETGPDPAYFGEETFYINVWYRPPTDSGTSYGYAKNAIFQIKNEVERIIRSGSLFNDTSGPSTSVGQKFFSIGGWKTMNDTSIRPAIFRVMSKVKVEKYNG
jgi:hypothetical protein